MKLIFIIIFVASLIPRGVNSYLYCSTEKIKPECSLVCKFTKTMILQTNSAQCEPLKIDMTLCKLLTLDLIEERKYKNVKVIRAEKNYIRQLYAHTFEELNLIEEIYLRDNMLMIIHPDAFYHLRNLNYLDLTKNYLIGFNLHLRGNAHNLPLTLLIGKNNDITNYITGDHQNTYYFEKQNEISEMKINPSTALKNLLNSFKLDGLDISYNNLLFLLEDTFKGQKNLRSINMAGNKLTYLPYGLFSRLTKLISIDMGYNYLTILDQNVFSSNKEILTINLEHNRLVFIHELTFQNLTNMRFLFLKDNNLQNINPNWFKSNIQLLNLDLSSNYVFRKTHNLITLILDDNSFATFEYKHFQYLSNLLEISIRNIKLDYIKNNLFFNNAVLRKIDLSDNNLTTLNESICNGQNIIKWVSISNNKIEQISKAFFAKLPSITYLRLDHNKIKNIDDAFEPNRALVNLNVSHNMIKHISSKTFANNVKLVHIDLSYNLISQLPKDVFLKLRLLSTLNLANNTLKTCPNLSKKFNLEALDLSNNKLTELSSEVYLNKRALLSLFLSNNMLKQLPLDIFKGASNLKRLNFNKNYIQSFFALHPMTNLQEIMASCNNFTVINNNTFTVNNTTKVYIHGNPINCNCLNLNMNIHTERFSDGTLPYCLSLSSNKCTDNLTAELLDNWKQRMFLLPSACDSFMWDKYDFGINICKIC